MRALDIGAVRTTEHRGMDDFLSAGLGLAGLAGVPVPFGDVLDPTAAELRRRAIQASWKAIADLGPLGGYGTVYGSVPSVCGREYQMFARIPGARASHRVLLQLPDAFDHRQRCLVVSASSGSRGIYGAIALAGAWGLPRGCAVAYTDKGAGTGYFDFADNSGVALDGRRARRGDGELEFQPLAGAPASGIAVKHMHSGDNPEAEWGMHVLDAAQFGLAMLDRAFPEEAPFTAQNTRIIATGLSNGGGAVLQAAGLDREHVLAGVVAIAPNVHVSERGRALYDVASEAAIWLPAALSSAQFASTPLARDPRGKLFSAWSVRCASLRAQGKLSTATVPEQAEQARLYLHARGWTDVMLAAAASTTAFDLWRVIATGYATSYLRRGVADMPCGFRYETVGQRNTGAPADPELKAAWWADASGIPPGNGIALSGGSNVSTDPNLMGCEGLRSLWTGDGHEALALQASIASTAARLPRADLPVWIVHGASDGLLPPAFGSEAYVDWLREEDRQPLYWKIPHAQHFDAFLALPGFGEHHVPLLPFAYAALDKLWAHLHEGSPLPDPQTSPTTRPRGAGMLDRSMLGLP